MSDNESTGSGGGECDLSRPEVTTKYRTAGGLADLALKQVIEACKPGADILTLCQLGDSVIEKETAKVYNKREKGEKVDKGVAFPTCISVNETCGNFSPLPNETRELAAGDMVKINLGCHIDGYVAVVGHTIVIGVEKIEGRSADVLLAAWTAAQAALREIRVGRTNCDVTSIVEVACEQFHCKPIIGVRSHQMKRFVIEGNHWIASKNVPDDKPETFTFGPNEVYYMDIIVSTGEGRTKASEARTTVFKRAVETKYQLKTPLARSFLGEVNKRFPTLPFTIRAIGDERAYRVGVSECMRHELLHPFPVLIERPNEKVAQVKFTVLLLPGGTKKITGCSFDQADIIKSEYEVTNAELKALLKTSANPKAQKKKTKSAQKGEIPDLVEKAE